MPHPTDRPATWFVTGASRGLGLHLVTALLTAGHQVAATTRSTDRLLAALGDTDRTNLLPLELQLTDPAAVQEAVDATTARFGQVDVVVNNAGYGFLGAVEETTDEDVRRMFDVQVNGTWNVVRAVLPGMRAARSGHVLNVSSVLGLLSFPGWGLYCAAKYALEGMTESLAAEVAEHGIPSPHARLDGRPVLGGVADSCSASAHPVTGTFGRRPVPGGRAVVALRTDTGVRATAALRRCRVRQGRRRGHRPARRGPRSRVNADRPRPPGVSAGTTRHQEGSRPLRPADRHPR